MVKYDALIIGSGFGGSVSAHKLTQAGLKVAMIERGPWRDTLPTRSAGIRKTSSFPKGLNVFTKLVRSITLPFIKGTIVTNKKGLYDVYTGKGLTLMCSSCVGGGSNVYTALHNKPSDPNYWETVSKHTKDGALDPHYAACIKKMGSRFIKKSDEVPNRTDFEDNEIFGLDRKKLPIKMGLLFPEKTGAPQERTDKNGITRKETSYGDDSLFGSFDGSKTTLDVAYLYDCINAGMKLFDMMEAIAIYQLDYPVGTKDKPRYRVECKDHETGKRTSIFADSVFLGAGMFNTLKLLAQSSMKYKGLHPIPNLGKGISGNADYVSYWAKSDKNKNYYQAPPAHGPLFLKQRPKSPLFIDVGLSFLNRVPILNWLSRRTKRHTLLVGMGKDESNGAFTYKNGKFRINYDPAKNPIFEEMKACRKEISKHSKSPVRKFPFNFTVHPFGGARIGDDPNYGVINGLGEMHTSAGLYVIDAAVFPKAIAAPPSMSIAAWSAHVAENFIKKYKKSSQSATVSAVAESV